MSGMVSNMLVLSIWGKINDTLPVARNALAYLFVPLNCNWKALVAHYFQDRFTGKVLANLTNNLLAHFLDNSVKVAPYSF